MPPRRLLLLLLLRPRAAPPPPRLRLRVLARGLRAAPAHALRRRRVRARARRGGGAARVPGRPRRHAAGGPADGRGAGVRGDAVPAEQVRGGRRGRADLRGGQLGAHHRGQGVRPGGRSVARRHGGLRRRYGCAGMGAAGVFYVTGGVAMSGGGAVGTAAHVCAGSVHVLHVGSGARVWARHLVLVMPRHHWTWASP